MSESKKLTLTPSRRALLEAARAGRLWWAEPFGRGQRAPYVELRDDEGRFVRKVTAAVREMRTAEEPWLKVGPLNVWFRPVLLTDAGHRALAGPVWTFGSNEYLPGRVRAVMGMEGHHVQGMLVIAAPTKKAAHELAEARKVITARVSARDISPATGLMVNALLAAGVITSGRVLALPGTASIGGRPARVVDIPTDGDPFLIGAVERAAGIAGSYEYKPLTDDALTVEILES